ncbi:MAG: chorismate synthase [Desulfohalobiaceae bacterium]|nr:chorismate synthase [Desulfohalobiaceae bacterium]
MSGNTFGRRFQLTTFGESHGPALGGIVDGCPAGLELNEEIIQRELEKRKPGQNPAGTPRKEPDQVKLLSGVFDGKTTGTPIGFQIINTAQRPNDYDRLRNVYRPGHADYTYQTKFGYRDHRGGGRASARETVSRIVGGAVAGQLLKTQGITVLAYTLEIGGIEAEIISPEKACEQPYFTPDPSVIELWNQKIEKIKEKGDSIGGVVEIQARGVQPGLGEPVFDKLDARLAYALMGVGAVKAVEIGAGLESAELTGSQNNDPISRDGFTRNNAGGILGGISSGQIITARATVKPIPSIFLSQKTLNTEGQEVSLQIKGRHDVSAIPRIVPVLKSMVQLTLADMYLLNQGSRL